MLLIDVNGCGRTLDAGRCGEGFHFAGATATQLRRVRGRPEACSASAQSARRPWIVRLGRTRASWGLLCLCAESTWIVIADANPCSHRAAAGVAGNMKDDGR